MQDWSEQSQGTGQVTVHYMLDLSFEEVQFLLDAVRKVGGSKEKSRRRYADSVRDKIQELGVEPTTKKGSCPDIEGNLYCEDS
jgi:hypothetical protein